MKHKKNYSMALLALCLISILPACKRVKYHAKPLKPIDTPAEYTQTNQNVTVTIKKLTPQETRNLFDGRGRLLLKRNKRISMVPLQVAITNNGHRPISISEINSSLPLVNPAKVYNRIRFGYGNMIATSCLGAAGASIVIAGGIAIATVNSICPCCLCYLIPIAYYTVVGSAIGTAVLTPTVSYARSGPTRKNNKQLHADIMQKTDIAQEIIKPKEQKNYLMFVLNKNMKKQFDISLTTNVSNSIPFDVALKPIK